MSERRSDAEKRDRIDEIEHKLTDDLAKALKYLTARSDANKLRIDFVSRMLVGLAVFIVVVLLAIGTWDVVLNSKTHDLANKNKSAVAAIQKQRVDAILNSCRDQNERHTRLMVFIGALVAHPQPGQRRLPKKVREQQATGFVNAIAPHLDCAKRVKQFAGNP